MNLDNIRTHKPGLIELENLHRSAVCIPLIKTEAGINVLFEIRSEDIPDQPGDVCLPGGAIEPGETPREAAVRESCEELLIDASQLNVIGESNLFHRTTASIYSFVAELSGYEGTFSRSEVSRVFEVPLDYFLSTEPERCSVETWVQPGEDFPYERIRGGRKYKWRSSKFDELFYEYDGITIWGITARIMYEFTKIIK